jgi:hypothetical protein
MNASVQMNRVLVPFLFRGAARAASVAVIVIWLELVLLEWIRYGSPDFRSPHQAAQAAALVVMFAGYLIGWRNELIGGLMSLIGAVAFGGVCALTFGEFLPISCAWFAVPGLLYLIAWYGNQRIRKMIL